LLPQALILQPENREATSARTKLVAAAPQVLSNR